MNIYFFVYLVSIIVVISGGISLYRHYKNTSGIYFLLATIFSSCWFIFFYLFFSNSDPKVLIYFSKIDFLISILTLYSFLLFIVFFRPNRGVVNYSVLSYSLVIGCVLGYIYIGTTWIIEGLTIDSIGIFREIPGKLYFIHVFLSIASLPLIAYFSKKQLEVQSQISQIRLRRVIYSASFLIAVLILLQLLLPLLGIWIFEKEIIILYTVFVTYVVLTVKRYYFSSFYQDYGIAKLGIILLSFMFSLLFLYVIKFLYLGIHITVDDYWNIGDSFSIIDTTITLLAFSFSFRGLSNFFLSTSSDLILKSDFDSLKQAISDTTSLEYLNKILQGGMNNIFKTNYSKVILFEEDTKFIELKKYFQHGLGNSIFINDIVFIEENKLKFNKEALLRDIDKDIMLVFPIITNKGELIGLYFLGKKFFSNFYTETEIASLFGLVRFLGLHIKYLVTYKKIQDYSLQLDQRIDDKTIEYNNLINKQKEFISMISHEIRSPIGSTIFQVDSIINDIDHSKASGIDIRNSIQNIGDQLANIGELLKKLFSIQYFDTRNVLLLKEKVSISNLLEKEFDIYSRMYEKITFLKKISPSVGFVNIDKIHFHQVITNLLENAIKFADPLDPIVLIECEKITGDRFRILIEDNGAGYGDIDPTILFEKYSKGQHSKLGLGMGLYLCKRIVTMHGGNITIHHGKILKGASFVIELPI